MIPDDLALAYTCKTVEVESRGHAMHLTKAGSLNKDSQSITRTVVN